MLTCASTTHTLLPLLWALLYLLFIFCYSFFFLVSSCFRSSVFVLFLQSFFLLVSLLPIFFLVHVPFLSSFFFFSGLFFISYLSFVFLFLFPCFFLFSFFCFCSLSSVFLFSSDFVSLISSYFLPCSCSLSFVFLLFLFLSSLLSLYTIYLWTACARKWLQLTYLSPVNTITFTWALLLGYSLNISANDITQSVSYKLFVSHLYVLSLILRTYLRCNSYFYTNETQTLFLSKLFP